MMMNNFEVEIKGFQSYHYNESYERLIGVGVIKCFDEKRRELSINLPDNNTQIFLSEIKVEFFNNFDTELNHISVNIDDDDEVIFSCISLSVTSERFSMLRNASNNFVITISFDIPKDRQFDEKLYNCNLKYRSFYYYENINHPAPQIEWRDIFKITKKWFLPNGRESQLGKISDELIHSLENWISSDPTKHMLGYFPNINELIGDLRASFILDNNNDAWLDYLRFTDSSISNETARTVPELFLKSIVDEPDELQNKLKWRYDNIWCDRQNIMSYLNKGMVKGDLLDNKIIDFKYLATESLEEIAAFYICRPWMQSPHLEWILIDALIFNESSIFALNTLGVMSKKTSHNIFKIIMKPFVSLLNESIYLLITAFISSIIDNQFGIIFWVVGATITLIRWLKPSTTLQINKIENYKLLAGDMVTISDKVRSQNFNAKLLMSLLYDLEKRGAVYSPWIFNLLDKRISRESI